MDYITTKMTRKRIRDVLSMHYERYSGEKTRKLAEFNCKDDKVNGSAIFFFLSGSPPKGYGIYQEGLGVLWLFDRLGKRFKEYKINKLEE